MKNLNFKAYLYILFFRLKGFKIYIESNNLFLIDKKRTILVLRKQDPSQSIKFHFNKKFFELKNPNKDGFFLIKKYQSPFLCILFT